MPYFFSAGFSIVESNFYSWQYSNRIWFNQFYRCLFFSWPLFEYYFSCFENFPIPPSFISEPFIFTIVFSLRYYEKVGSSNTLLFFVLPICVNPAKLPSWILDLFLTPAVADNRFADKISAVFCSLSTDLSNLVSSRISEVMISVDNKIFLWFRLLWLLLRFR